MLFRSIFVTRNDFLAVDGMNSALAGWGFEDDDFLLRLQLGAGLRATAMGTVTHLTHDNPMRDLNGKSVEEQIKLNYTIAVQRYKEVIHDFSNPFKRFEDFGAGLWSKHLGEVEIIKPTDNVCHGIMRHWDNGLLVMRPLNRVSRCMGYDTCRY